MASGYKVSLIINGLTRTFYHHWSTMLVVLKWRYA